jgi:hypothetical protein
MIDSLGWQTIRIKWLPQDQDYHVKITGMVQAKSQPTLKTESASSDTSTARDVGVEPATSTAGGSGEVKREKADNTAGVGMRSATPQTSGKDGLADADEDAEAFKKDDLNNQQLSDLLKRMEIMNLI